MSKKRKKLTRTTVSRIVTKDRSLAERQTVHSMSYLQERTNEIAIEKLWKALKGYVKAAPCPTTLGLWESGITSKGDYRVDVIVDTTPNGFVAHFIARSTST